MSDTHDNGGMIPLSYRPKDAAKALGISARKLWTLTNAKQIPHLRCGRAVIYPREALERWLVENAERMATLES